MVFDGGGRPLPLPWSGSTASGNRLTEVESETLGALLERLFPADELGPGALDIGVLDYVQLALSEAYAGLLPVYRIALGALNNVAQAEFGVPFAALPIAIENVLVDRLERRQIRQIEDTQASGFFEIVWKHLREGLFCDPIHGGNRDMLGWRLIGFPGAQFGYSAAEQALDIRIDRPPRSVADLLRESEPPNGADPRAPRVMPGSVVRPEVDVCLVGLGAAGGMTAYALTQAGRSVVALEAGPPRTVTRPDHVMDELMSSSIRNGWGQTKFNNEVPTWRPNSDSPREPETPFYVLMSNGTGGSSVSYGAISFRFNPDDFRVRSNTVARYGHAALPEGTDITDWPLSYDDLEPYYDAAERLLGVSGQAGNLRGTLIPGGNPFEGPRQQPYPLPPLRTSGLGNLFREHAANAGYHPFPTPAAVASVDYDGRPACTYCSYCVRMSCHVNAKGSVLATVIPRALETGRLEIRTGARAVEIVVDSGGRPIGVEYIGPEGRELQPAGTIILASFTFENVRLLLLSRSRHFPNGLGNNTGQVGLYYMSRQSPAVFGVFEGRRLHRFTGPVAQGQTIDDFDADNFDHAGLGFLRGAYLSVYNQFLPISSSGIIPPEIPRWGQKYKQFLVQQYDSIAMVGVSPEVLPYTANFLDLDPEVCDPLGVPVTRITFDIYENERRQMRFLQDRAFELIRAMGATSTWSFPLFKSAISSHDVGGTRMGKDSDRSVVDTFGRLHEAPNVVVLGGSTFPTLPGPNPTLTIQAMALRTGKHLVEARSM